MAPVITIDSPSAMIMNSWKRSAKWPVCTFQFERSSVADPGTQ